MENHGTSSDNDAHGIPLQNMRSPGASPLHENQRRSAGPTGFLRRRKPQQSKVDNDEDIETYHKSLLFNPKIEVDDVLTWACRYQKLEISIVELKNLPKYDDITSYDVPEEEERRLWHRETERLVQLTLDDTLPLFNSHGFLGETTEEGFQQLAGIADQILCNFGIAHHDNLVLQERDKVKRTRDPLYRLTMRCLHRLAEDMPDDVDEDAVKFKPPQHLSEHNREVYHMLIDYSTAIISRYLYRCATSSEWHSACIATLAKLATKMKILERDPARFAAASLEAEEDQDDEEEQYKRFDFWDRGPASIFHDKQDNESSTFDAVYRQHEFSIRSNIGYLFTRIFAGLLMDKRLSKSKQLGPIEMTSRIYRTGLLSSNLTHTLICSDKDGEYCAATDSNEIRFSRAAFDILLSNASRIEQTDPANPIDTPARPIEVDWLWSSTRFASMLPGQQPPGHLNHPKQGKISTCSIDDVVSLMLPLTLCDANTSMKMFYMYHTMKFIMDCEGKEPVQVYAREDFEVNFTIKVAVASTSGMQAREILGPVRLFRSLKDATVLSGGLLPGASMNVSGSDSTNHSRVAGLSQPQSELEALFAEQMRKTTDWVIHEVSITVPFQRFTNTVLALGTVIILGGVALPFLGRVKLGGVDPSNLSTFVWVSVLFAVLMAQSWYVPAWRWHDFLHGRIICRSVSELAQVTGIDPQHILHKLLVDDWESTLRTRGPYNGMFKNQSSEAEQGFSIDIPCETSTLFASGFVLFQGLGKYDWHVLCMDVRGSQELLMQQHHHWGGFLGAPLLTERLKSGNNRVLKLSEQEFMGEKILGLFVADRKFG